MTFAGFTNRDSPHHALRGLALSGSRDVSWVVPAVTPAGVFPPTNVALLSTAPRTNFAASTSGAIATSSSNYSSAFPAASVINGDRAGFGWSAGGVWNDGTLGTYPDWIQVDFRGAKTIDQIVVYTIQDNPYTNPAESTDTMTFANFGLLDFTVEGWNGPRG